MMRRTLSFLFLAFALSGATKAFAADGPGSLMFPWSRISPDPAVLGSGSAGFADTERSAWAPFRNAALLPLSGAQTAEAAVSYTRWMPSADGDPISHFGGALSGHFGSLAVGAGLRYLPGTAYDIRNEIGVKTGSFTPSDLEACLSAGYAILDGLSVGATFRFLKSSVAEGEDYSSFAGDVAALYRFGAFTASAGLSNLGTSVEDSLGNRFDIPTSATAGFCGDFTFAEVHAVKACVDAGYFFSGAFSAAVGAQYSYNRLVFLRAGYHFGTNDAPLPSFLSLGAGVEYQGIGLNLAYLVIGEDIAGSLSVGLSYRF